MSTTSKDARTTSKDARTASTLASTTPKDARTASTPARTTPDPAFASGEPAPAAPTSAPQPASIPAPASARTPQRFYVTTTIPYVNADPHLGHALELVQADALARHRRLRGDDVRLQSGTDDNALKNVQAAEHVGLAVADFVTLHADTFERLREVLNLSYDDFIRTSQDARHRPGAERLWQACADAGDFYRREYEGLYCVGCEQFYSPDELADGLCPDHEVAPELVREENWFFRLSRYQQPLLDLLASGRLTIEPAVRANEVRSFIAGGLEDFSISRSVERTHGWGVPVPGDPTQVMYVWWDALGNYITSLDYGSGGADADAFRSWWQDSDQRVHVIGKGVVRFHAVYWPAMLLSAGLPLPTHVFVHDYLTANGRRLSKSLGHVVDPTAVAHDYGTEALRWWLLARVPKVGDTDFTVERLVEAANRDLAGGIGNLAQRVVSMVHRYRDGVVPSPGLALLRTDAGAVDLRDACAELPVRIDAALAGFDLRAATAAISWVVGAANRYIEDVAPWVLAKAERSGRAGHAGAGAGEPAHRLDVALAVLVDTLRVLARELTPFLPEGARRLAFHSGSEASDAKLPPPEPVFPRLEVSPPTD